MQMSAKFSFELRGCVKFPIDSVLNAVDSTCIKSIKKVKVSHSLTAVGAVGVRVPLYLGHT